MQEVNLYYTNAPFLADHNKLIQRLAKLNSVAEVKAGGGLHLTQTKYDCWLDVNQQAAQQYLDKLEAQRQVQEKLVKQLESRLKNKAYIKNAPAELVDETRAQLKNVEGVLENIIRERERFSNAAKQ